MDLSIFYTYPPVMIVKFRISSLVIKVPVI
jgi:hypothetical protein